MTPHTIQASFQVDGSNWKKMVNRLAREPRIPRKIKKRYKRLYGSYWKLNYEIHTGKRTVTAETKDGRIVQLGRNIVITSNGIKKR